MIILFQSEHGFDNWIDSYFSPLAKEFTQHVQRVPGVSLLYKSLGIVRLIT